MSLLGSLLEKRGSLPLDDAQPWREAGILSSSSSGVSVTPGNAMKYSAVYACVRVLAETVAGLPLITYKRMKPAGKERATSFYLYSLLHDQPNPLMTSFEWRETAMGHLALWGNHYSELEINPRGRVEAVWPLNPGNMEKIDRKDNVLTYYYRLPNNDLEEIPAWRILHIRGLSSDGVMGISPVGLARQAIGMGLAAEEFGARFFANGAKPGGVLQHPGILDDDAYKRMKSSWVEAHGGLSNAHRVAILEEGVTYEAVGIPPEQAQFLETRNFQVRDIARIFRVPPHLIGDLDRATFSNVEQQSIDFVVHTIRPWLVRIEQAIQSRLMSANERNIYFAEFLVDGLLRGDITSRYAAYQTAILSGFMERNEARELENLNPDPKIAGFLVPMNMVEAGQELPEMEPIADNNARSIVLRNGAEVRASQHQAAAQRHRLQTVYMPLYEDVTGRIIRREANDITNAAQRIFNKRDAAAFEEWLNDFYEGHTDFVTRQLTPLTEAYAKQVIDLAARELGKDAPVLTNFIRAYTESAASRITARNLNRLLKVLADNVDDQLGAIEAELEGWRDIRGLDIARDESVRSNNAFAMAAYGALAVIVKRWITFGDNCPYCDSLSGRTMAIDAPFIQAGQPLQPEGAKTPLITKGNIGHAPAHRGCDCMVVAGL